MNNTTTTNDQVRRAVLGWVSDPGHSWLAVSMDDEHGFQGVMQFASTFSLVDLAGDNFAGIVYLEEDEDAPRFIKHFGLDLAGVETYTLPDDNVIRNLPRGANTF